MDSFPHLDKNILKELQEMIREVNPYAHLYQHAADVLKEKPTEDIKLVLKTTGKGIDPHNSNPRSI